MTSFTHLQVKSGYSLLSSTITIEKLLSRAEELAFSALALTDDQVLYGVIPFYQACIRKGIKPIIGMTTAVDSGDNRDTMILLAKTNYGYKQLIQLSTYLQTSQLSAIAKEDLSFYTEDVIGVFPAANESLAPILDDGEKGSIASFLETWKLCFAQGDFYVGVADHGTGEEKKRNETLKSLQSTYSTSVVAVNDVRYLHKKDVIAFDCLQAMKDGKQWSMQVTDSARNNHHLRSYKEMAEVFSDWPEVLAQTEEICERCTVTFDFSTRMLPSFPVPEQTDAHSYLKKKCWGEAEATYTTITKEIHDRLSYELSIIQSMQFSDYFLIVADFISFAKENQIMVGPGRGSAAGSLVAYVLGITEVDPLRYGLLFERFLNPERVTMPDIDVDFSDYRRDEVISYVQNKYGNEHVAQIVTFGTFAARSLIRELVKVMNVDKQDVNYILREIPAQADQPLVEYVRASSELNDYVKQSEKLKLLFAVAIVLEGLPRHISTHAAGVVISENPLVEHVPLTLGANDTSLTQFAMNDLEAIGLLKMDFLGLRNLTLLERIVKSIYYTTKHTVHLDQLPDDDPLTFNLLQQGMTNGVFQLESQGMKKVLTKLKPTSFEDIVAVNALYRPGPMEYIPTYIARKHQQERVTYPHPDLAAILQNTYGVLVYQEQIMQIAHKIAGFSLGEADILRRAVSKKQEDLMAEQKEAFVQGCVKNGYDETVAEEIFVWIVKFSNYGFNRSHAVAYSKIAYQLAYLKAHYPADFFAELLSSATGQQDKVTTYIKEAGIWNLNILPPSINASFHMYTVEKQAIRMGLLAIKGIGNQVVQEIVRIRKDGWFKNLFDFCMRVSLRIVNRQALELLVLSGAFDDIYSNRASLLASINKAMEQGELFREFQGQSFLFYKQIELEANYVVMEDLSIMTKLADEKELLGIYVSSHPLVSYRNTLRNKGYVTMAKANQMVGTRRVRSVAIIQSVKTIRTKRGDSMAFLTIGDETGDMEAVVFPDVFRITRSLLIEEIFVMLEGKIESRNNGVQWLVSHIDHFEVDIENNIRTERLFIKVSEQNGEAALNAIMQTTKAHPGGVPIILYTIETRQAFQLEDRYDVNPVPACMKELRDYFGKENVVLEKSTS